jgi:hypothetical protein
MVCDKDVMNIPGIEVYGTTMWQATPTEQISEKLNNILYELQSICYLLMGLFIILLFGLVILFNKTL